MLARKRPADYRGSDVEYPRPAAEADARDAAEDFVLAPLVDKIAYSIARGLTVAVKELELHIAGETRKVGDAVDRRLDTIQSSLQDLTAFMGEQRTSNAAVQDQLQQLTAADASLREANARQDAEIEAVRAAAQDFSTTVSQRIDTATVALQEADARQAKEVEALRTETKASAALNSQRIDAADSALKESEARQVAELAKLESETKAFSQSVTERIDGLCRELGVQQEDMAAVKATLVTFSSRVDSLVERLDRQADAVRSMCTAYSQRETELEQLVDGLARLRAYPTPLPSNGL
jgi:chromosome segregation ATPase